jgi:hypothetical protein
MSITFLQFRNSRPWSTDSHVRAAKQSIYDIISHASPLGLVRNLPIKMKYIQGYRVHNKSEN